MWDSPSIVGQPDGSSAEVRLFGDEFYHWLESPGGYTVVRDPVSGWYCYADVSTDGMRLLSTGARLGNPPPSDLEPGLQLAASVIADIVARKPSPSDGSAEKILDKPAVINGEVLGLTILVDFPDLDFETDVPDPADQQAWISDVHDFLNLTGYTGHGNNGSVLDYFQDVSLNNLSYSNHLTSRFYESTATRAELVADHANWDDVLTDILQQMDTEGFDFSPFDANADGLIDAINIYYWGPVGSQELWPHYSDMIPVDLDGLTAEHYMVSALRNFPELRTFCHETGHLLGQWPDLYSVAIPQDGFGLGDYCLMAYAGGGDLDPVHPSAYPKKLAGWMVPVVLDRPGTGLVATSGDNTGYIIPHPDPAVTTEYFLIENRQEIGRDDRIDDSGLAIYHVDEQRAHQEFSTHYMVHLVQADGLWELENGQSFGNATDLYAAPDHPDYDPSSDPRATWWNSSFIESNIQNVSTSGPVMTFDYPGCAQLVSVTVNPPDLGFEWTMSGPNGFSLPGTTNNEFIVPTCGVYTVSFENVPLYGKPPDVTRDIGVTADPFIDFAGTYTLSFNQGGPNDLGDTGRATALSAVDYDNDGDDDLFIANFGTANRLLINQGGSGFINIAPAVLANAAGIVDASWADGDSDGDQDLFLVRTPEGHLVLDQQDGTLVDISGQSADLCSTGPATAGNWGDIDNDGALDIFLTRYNHANEAYKGVIGPSIQLLPSAISGFASRGIATSGVHWGDINHDGWNDLLLNATSPEPVEITRVLQNVNGEYQFWSGRVNTVREGIDAAWADFNNDGILDMVILESNGSVVFYLVGPSGFVNFSNPVPPSPGATSLAAGDFNNDGWVDLYVTRNGGSDILVVNQLRTVGDMNFLYKTLTFTDDHMLGDNQIAVAGDFNGDGKLDLYVARDGAPNFLVENQAGGDNHWLEVDLTGVSCNRDALGARITVVADGLSQIREVQSDGGSGQNSTTAHFGLGPVAAVDFVTVRWPGDNPLELYSNTVALDSRLSITQRFAPPVVSSYIERDGQQLPIAENTLRGCPAGDDDVLVIMLDFDDASMENTPQVLPEQISLITDGLDFRFYDDTSLDTPGTPANGYQVTLRRSQVGSCNLPNSDPPPMEIRYLDMPVGSIAGLGVQSSDITGDGWVNLMDLPLFAGFFSGQPENLTDYYCGDFVHDGAVDLLDVTHFAVHFSHLSPNAGAGSGPKIVSDARISFLPETSASVHVGEIRMQVLLESGTSINAVAVVLGGKVGDYTVVGWEADPGLANRSLLTGREKSTSGEWVLMGMNLEKETTRPLKMGVLILAPSLESGLLAAMPVAGDFNLLAGEILTAEGVVESLLETDGSDPMPAKGKGIQRVFPNPFNPSVTIEYALDHPARVSLQIHDLAGRLVATLVDEYQVPQGGNLSAVWDGNNNQGGRSSSGLYFWRLAIGGQVETGRMMLIE
jgi:M6 family metalloprotease-like protein